MSCIGGSVGVGLGVRLGVGTDVSVGVGLGVLVRVGSGVLVCVSMVSLSEFRPQAVSIIDVIEVYRILKKSRRDAIFFFSLLQFKAILLKRC